MWVRLISFKNIRIDNICLSVCLNRMNSWIYTVFAFIFHVLFFLTVKFEDAAKQKVEDQLLNNIDENVVMKALDGFLIMLSTDGDVIYVSENIHEYIGIHQVCGRRNINSQVFYFQCNFGLFVCLQLFFFIDWDHWKSDLGLYPSMRS